LDIPDKSLHWVSGIDALLLIHLEMTIT
jgi:hypothetical protein